MKRIFIGCLSLLLTASTAFSRNYYASDFGIRSDGKTLNTTSIQKAINTISSEGGGKLVFKVGRYLTGTIELKDNVTIVLGEGAVIVGSENPYDYRFIGETYGLLVSNKAKKVSVVGTGIIDGRGNDVASNVIKQVTSGLVKDPLKNGRPSRRPLLVNFYKCQDVVLKGITLKNPANWTCKIHSCNNIYVDGVVVKSRAYWNNDGIDIVDCNNAVVKNCYVNSSDDGICLKSIDSKSRVENVLIYNNAVCSSANAIKLGTSSVGGFRNIRIVNNKVFNTFRSAIAIESVDGGIVEDIVVDSLTVYNTGHPIFLVIGNRKGAQSSRMENIQIKNVCAEISDEKPDYGLGYEGPTFEHQPRNICPCSIVGLDGQFIQNIRFENVIINYPGGGDPSFAFATPETVPEKPSAYPEFSQFRELPSWGLYIRHAKNVVFQNVQLKAKSKDYRPAIVLDDVHDSDFLNVSAKPSTKINSFEITNSCSGINKK